VEIKRPFNPKKAPIPRYGWPRSLIKVPPAGFSVNGSRFPGNSINQTIFFFLTGFPYGISTVLKVKMQCISPMESVSDAAVETDTLF
jgi:hypothetical protein